jgi:hypothetical protein
LPISVEVINLAREATANPADWAAICLGASRPYTDTP